MAFIALTIVLSLIGYGIYSIIKEGEKYEEKLLSIIKEESKKRYELELENERLKETIELLTGINGTD